MRSSAQGGIGRSSWVFAGSDPYRFWQIDPEGSDAEHLPEVSAIGTIGFLNECSRAARPDNPVTWSVEQPRPDLVIYRMDRSYG